MQTRPPAAATGDFRSLLREDGAVVIPPTIALDVLRSLTRDLTAQIRRDGGEPSPAIRRVLYALHSASERHTTSGFATETPPERSGNVEITAGQMAREMGCTPQYVRRLCASGVLRARRAGHQWLITIERET